MVAFDEEAQYVAQYVGRVEMRKNQSSISLKGIPPEYHQHKQLSCQRGQRNWLVEGLSTMR